MYKKVIIYFIIGSGFIKDNINLVSRIDKKNIDVYRG